MADIEEGAPEFFDGAAVLAETVAGGQVEHPDTDDGEQEQAGDPDVAGYVVLLGAGDEEAANHGDDEGEQGAEDLGKGGVGVGVGKRHRADGEGEHKHCERRVREEPEGFAAKVSERFVLREVLIGNHGRKVFLGKGYLISGGVDGVLLRLSWHGIQEVSGWVAGEFCPLE